MTGADGAVTLTRDDARDAWLWPSGRVAIGESAEAWRGLGAWPDVVGCFPIAYVKTAEEAASRLGARLPEGDSRPVLTLVGSTWCWPSEHVAILQDRDGVYRMWRDGSDTSISGTAPTLTAALQILGARLPTEPETLIARSDGGYGWPSGRWAIDPPDKHSGTYCAHRDSEADVNGAYFGRLEDAARYLCARLPDDVAAIPLEDGGGVAPAVCSKKEPTDPTALEQEQARRLAEISTALNDAGAPILGTPADRIRALASRREPLDDRARGIAAELLAELDDYARACHPPSEHVLRALRLAVGGGFVSDHIDFYDVGIRMVEAIRGMLSDIIAERRVDRYQDVTLEYGDHPDVTTADLSPDDGYAPCGAWEPYAVVRVKEESDYGRHLRTVDSRCWRRPLRRVAS